MQDLISRQALCEYALNQKDKSITPNDIMRFPSAQPETHEERTETHTCDLISRQAAIDAILAVTGNSSVRELYEHVQEHGLSDMWSGGVSAAIDIIIAVPSVQPEKRTEERTETHACDLIDRSAAIDAIEEYADRLQIVDWKENPGVPYKAYALNWCINTIRDLPSAQPEPCGDVVSRNAIVQKLNEMDRYVSTELRLCDTDKKFPQNEVFIVDDVYEEIVEQLPSAQPERTCVNCGRTVNNGGWYADGGTRCPIEEHYALPKDGYCHLWERRNVTDDDYPERRTDE